MSDNNSAEPSTSNSSMVTDENTRKRFANLAIVGNFLVQISNDNAEQTNYFLAKTALQEFDVAVQNVDLDPVTRSGVLNLINYLTKKIEKRNRQAEGEFSQD